MFRKTFFLSLSILCLFQNVENVTVSCHKELMTSYGMNGNFKPREMIIEMCPNVQLSCCRKDDQLQIYGNWVTGKTKNEVSTHYGLVLKNYSKMLKVFLATEKVGKKILRIQRAKKIGNCKLMAERLTSFEIESTIIHIQKMIKKLELFMKTTYQGFYCTLCDAVNHMFIIPKNGTIIYSEKFCRNIVENTLPSLIYFQSHMMIIANLVSNLVNSCDFKGNYGVINPVAKNIFFKMNPKNVRDLEKCKLYRNDKSWYVYCKPICEKFNMTNYPKFFEGDQIMVKNWIKFTMKKLKKIIINSKKPKKIKFKKKKRRVLEGIKKFDLIKKVVQFKKIKKDKNKSKIEDRILAGKAEKDPKPKGQIYSTIPTGRMIIGKYKSLFRKEGLSPFSNGSVSIINEIMFNQIKRLINQQKAMGVHITQMNAIGRNALGMNINVFTTVIFMFVAFFF